MEKWEFGHAVRRWRERVTPDAIGLPPGTRRRAPGLRREELAGLTGISVDYLTRLEQGRSTSPSTQVVEALARALRLADRERELLFRLSGQPAPGNDVVSSRVTPSVQRLLDRLSTTAVAVYDAAWTLIVANAPYDALMGETSSLRGIERNAVWRNLVGPGNRAAHTPSEKADLDAQLVADLRLTAARYPADRRLQLLIRQLGAASSRFVELWESDVPAPRTSRHKVIEHPVVGPIALDCDTLVVTDDDIRVMVYSAEPASDDADRLALAIVLGTQQLVE
ncbi:helix-turn-helix transcriptional regulator [Paramicrobacterium chengjingii]|uniref:Helix-turn-helix domain-containing protein n=1 Tax=Paramicrobacterium chengjingii TaxID=2769067 RepID=A0ABX6YIE7_9MICO|nr:helix-turn-helix transcriptional regulator [Microbacterium chengjingii]QPZ38117.1 helix-turn-helix domain-containing protein [Microbacterium chengjingii]